VSTNGRRFEQALLGFLSLCFLAWAGVVWKASEHLSAKFDTMYHEFSKYSVETEHRMTALEQKQQRILDITKKLVDENERK
jgi:hypothetical protein